jgi:hypothetical protein
MMDAAVLYMIVMFANGRTVIPIAYPFQSSQKCRETAQYMHHSELANHYLRLGASRVLHHCGPRAKLLKIAR